MRARMAGRASDTRYRDAKASDMTACASVFVESVADLSRRLGVEFRRRDPAVIARRLGYLRGTDPKGFQVATRGGRAVAFASTILREDVHFLSMFWARPAMQGRGVGRALLARAFNRPDPPATAVRCVFASLDTRAQSLYLKIGMVPRSLIYGLARDGVPPALPPPEVPVELSQVGEPGAVTKSALALAAALDRKNRGCRRDTDIAFTLDQPGARFFEAQEDGDPVGYVILTKDGMVGPGGVIDPRYAEGLAWAGLQAQRDLGAERPALQVVGTNDGALRAAFAAGLRITFHGVWMTQREFGRFDRYFATAGDIF